MLYIYKFTGFVKGKIYITIYKYYMYSIVMYIWFIQFIKDKIHI